MIDLTRRRFLQASAVMGAGAAAPVALPNEADAAGHHTLVVVVLRGGLDGLSAVVPFAGHYQDNRRRTAIPTGQLHRLDDHFGLHPSLGPLMPLYRRGEMAPIVAVGSPLQSRSHFDQQAAIDLGVPGRLQQPTGWLARHLQQTAGRGRLRAMSTGSRLASALRGATGATAINSLDGFDIAGLQHLSTDRAARARQAFRDAAGPGPLGKAASDALTITDLVASGGADRMAPAYGASYPDDPIGRRFRDVAALVRAGIGLEVGVIDITGWDTHAFQGAESGRLAANLEALARSLSAFMTDLGDRRGQMTVVVVSEFGRRVDENGAGGTDHGRGGVAFVLGGGIRGGQVHGDWPGIAPGQLDDGDVRVTTDVRDVLGEVLDRRVGNTDLGAVFPDHRHRPVGFA